MPPSPRVQTKDCFQIRDILFAELAIRGGKTTREAIQKGRKVLKEMGRFGINRTLSSVLVERKFIDKGQEKQVLEQLAGIQVTCAHCRQPASLEGMSQDGRVRCDRCRCLLSIRIAGGEGGGQGAGIEERLEAVLLESPKEGREADAHRPASASQQTASPRRSMTRLSFEDMSAEKNQKDTEASRSEDAKSVRPRVGARNAVKRYQIESAISSGPFGRLYRARHPEDPGMPVALKIFTPGLLSDGKTVAILKKKLELWNRLEAEALGPHVLENEDPIFYLVRPYIDETFQPLSSLKLDGLASPPEFIFGIASQLMRFHEARLVHGNLKPSNIFLNQENPEQVFLVDPSLHLLVPADDKIARWRSLADSPRFCAPEVINGGDPTQVSDVYSLGWVFYAILAGAPPFSGLSPPEILRRHQEGPCPELPAQAGKWRRLHAAMTALNPKERPSNGTAVLKHVEEILSGKNPSVGTVTPRATPSEVEERGLKKKRRSFLFRYALGPAAFLAIFTWVGFHLSSWMDIRKSFSQMNRLQVLYNDLAGEEYKETDRRARQKPESGRDHWEEFLHSFPGTRFEANAEAEKRNYSAPVPPKKKP